MVNRELDIGRGVVIGSASPAVRDDAVVCRHLPSWNGGTVYSDGGGIRGRRNQVVADPYGGKGALS